MGNRLYFQGNLAINRNFRPCHFLLLFVLLVVMSTSSFAQTITIQKTSISVEALLQEITLQSNLNFSYSPKIVDTQQNISFHINDAPIEKVLDLLAEKLGVGYTLLDNQIVLYQKAISQKELEKEKPPPSLFSISGFINDALSGESLIGATVAVKGTSQGVSTNAFGFYSLQLPAGQHTLLFSYVGFQAQQLIVQLVKNKKQDVPLQPASLNLPGVVVHTSTHGSIRAKQTGSMELKPDDLNNLPEFGGESGLIRGLQSLPGIKAHSDGSAFFFVRGGAKDQNLIIMDDAPIYNPSHLFGFYSVVVPEFTKSMQVYKSDIPVHLGDRLSSIVDIRTKDGNLNKTELNAAFNPLIFRLSLEGPVKRGKSAYFISLRSSNFRWIYKRDSPDADLGFTDFSFKWNVKFNDKNRLYYTLFVGDDRLENTSLGPGFTGVGWRNVASTIRWNHIFGAKLFSNTTLYSGNYNYQISTRANSWYSGIGRVSLKSDFTNYNSTNHKTRFGFEVNAFTFNPGRVTGEAFSNLFPNIQQDLSRQSVLYFNKEFTWQDRWHLSAGLRFSSWQSLGPTRYFTFDENYEPVDSVLITNSDVYQTYQNLDPRASVQYEIDNFSSLKLSYGIYHQNIQLISNSTSPFTAMEVWLPSSPNIKPQSAHQVSLSYLKQFPEKNITMSAEGYYKKMNNQIDYADHANTLLNPFVEGELRFGQLQSYGLELLLKKHTGRFNGWLSYTLSRALQQTDAVNGRRTYPAYQDRPHDFSLMLNYALKRRILFSAYWTWYTGSAFSSPTGFYTFNNSTAPIYGEKHNDRLPDYKRLDIAFKFILNKRADRQFQHSLTFSIYNFLAHKNIIAVNFNKVPNGDERPIVKANLLSEEDLIATQADLVRFFPSLTYSLKL